MRQLGSRVHDAITQAAAALRPEPIDSMTWTTVGLHPQGRLTPSFDEIEAKIHRRDASTAERNRNAFRLAWLSRCEAGEHPLTLGALHFNGGRITTLHLPAEVFVEYQLAAQQAAPDRFVAVAAYGDDGPWYLPTAEAYPQGGYEVRVAFCEPDVDRLLTQSIQSLLQPKTKTP
jgi:hypothetical protein